LKFRTKGTDVGSSPRSESEIRRDVGLLLNVLVRNGEILGFQTTIRTGQAPRREVHVTAFVHEAADHDKVHEAVCRELELLREPVVVTVRTGQRRTERNRAPSGTGAARQRQWLVTLAGCVAAVLLAILIGTMLR
jgi:hypothetical protein